MPGGFSFSLKQSLNEDSAVGAPVAPLPDDAPTDREAFCGRDAFH